MSLDPTPLRATALLAPVLNYCFGVRSGSVVGSFYYSSSLLSRRSSSDDERKDVRMVGSTLTYFHSRSDMLVVLPVRLLY